jgi:hypothetical protein
MKTNKTTFRASTFAGNYFVIADFFKLYGGEVTIKSMLSDGIFRITSNESP